MGFVTPSSRFLFELVSRFILPVMNEGKDEKRNIHPGMVNCYTTHYFTKSPISNNNVNDDEF